MAVKAVVFDVGETLLDETALWESAADAARVPRFTLMGVLGAWPRAASRIRTSGRFSASSVRRRPGRATASIRTLFRRSRQLRARGLTVGAVGNTPVEAEDLLREHVDFVGSSARWGVEKPAAAFFERVAAEAGLPVAEIAYVGDRVDNDVEPALAAGMVAVHIRRGPWGYLHEPPPAALRIESLDELSQVLDV